MKKIKKVNYDKYDNVPQKDNNQLQEPRFRCELDPDLNYDIDNNYKNEVLENLIDIVQNSNYTKKLVDSGMQKDVANIFSLYTTLLVLGSLMQYKG